MKCSLSLKSCAIDNAILLVVISELFLLGGGRLVEIGPLSLRMILYFFAQLYTIAYIFKNKIDTHSLTLFLYFIASLLLSAVIGILNGADFSVVLGDIKPLSYFLMIFFFSAIIDTRQKVMLVVKSIKACSLILMAVYFLLLLGMYFNIFDYKVFYEWMSETGEIFFRPGIGFFYKGFLYLCVGFIFFLFSDKRSDKVIAVLLLVSIVLTFTRGFLLSTGATLVAYTLFFARKNAKALLNIVIITAFALLFTPWFLTQLGDKSESNLPRIIAFEQVKESLSPFSVLVGHGLGIGVAEREDHMEASYLEIFHKQGVMGLVFWFFIFALIMKLYYEIRNKENKDIALPFALSTLLIYIQTATNPFLNNPIGMSMVLITLSVVKVLGDERYE